MAEFGYVSLDELASVRIPLRLSGRTLGYVGVEYDEHWMPVTLREAIARYDETHGYAPTNPQCRYCGRYPGLHADSAEESVDTSVADPKWDGDGDVCVDCFEEHVAG